MARWKRDEKHTGLARVTQGFRAYRLWEGNSILASIDTPERFGQEVCFYAYAPKCAKSKDHWPDTPEGIKAAKAACIAYLKTQDVQGDSNAAA